MLVLLTKTEIAGRRSRVIEFVCKVEFSYMHLKIKDIRDYSNRLSSIFLCQTESFLIFRSQPKSLPPTLFSLCPVFFFFSSLLAVLLFGYIIIFFFFYILNIWLQYWTLSCKMVMTMIILFQLITQNSWMYKSSTSICTIND